MQQSAKVKTEGRRGGKNSSSC